MSAADWITVPKYASEDKRTRNIIARLAHAECSIGKTGTQTTVPANMVFSDCPNSLASACERLGEIAPQLRRHEVDTIAIYLLNDLECGQLGLDATDIHMLKCISSQGQLKSISNVTDQMNVRPIGRVPKGNGQPLTVGDVFIEDTPKHKRLSSPATFVYGYMGNCPVKMAIGLDTHNESSRTLVHEQVYRQYLEPWGYKLIAPDHSDVMVSANTHSLTVLGDVDRVPFYIRNAKPKEDDNANFALRITVIKSPFSADILMSVGDMEQLGCVVDLHSEPHTVEFRNLNPRKRVQLGSIPVPSVLKPTGDPHAVTPRRVLTIQTTFDLGRDITVPPNMSMRSSKLLKVSIPRNDVAYSFQLTPPLSAIKPGLVPADNDHATIFATNQTEDPVLIHRVQMVQATVDADSALSARKICDPECTTLEDLTVRSAAVLRHTLGEGYIGSLTELPSDNEIRTPRSAVMQISYQEGFTQDNLDACNDVKPASRIQLGDTPVPSVLKDSKAIPRAVHPHKVMDIQTVSDPGIDATVPSNMSQPPSTQCERLILENYVNPHLPPPHHGSTPIHARVTDVSPIDAAPKDTTVELPIEPTNQRQCIALTTDLVIDVSVETDTFDPEPPPSSTRNVDTKLIPDTMKNTDSERRRAITPKDALGALGIAKKNFYR
jgi:hypothetical protein